MTKRHATRNINTAHLNVDELLVNSCFNSFPTMKISRIHSHLNGREWILVHERGLWSEIEEVVEAVDAHKCMTKVSKEKTMRGKLLYSPTDLNKAFKRELQKRKWEEVRTDYWVKRKVDQGRVGLGLHFERRRVTVLNVFLMHMAPYLADQIDVGVEIVPATALQEDGGSRRTSVQLQFDVPGLTRVIPAMPLVLLAIGP